MKNHGRSVLRIKEQSMKEAVKLIVNDTVARLVTSKWLVRKRKSIAPGIGHYKCHVS